MSKNIFKQNEQNWEVIFILNNEEFITNLTDLIEESTESYSIFENDEQKDKFWQIKAYFGDEPDAKDFAIKVEDFFNKSKLSLFVIDILKIEDIDWALEVQKTFKPFEVGKFYIHSSYYKDLALANNKIAIEINPGRAFGTGEHETTQLCIQAMSEIKKMPKNILDLGCGSGILGIAASKIFKANIVASDIDEVSILVAKENAIQNNEAKIVFLTSDGFTAHELDKKFDLIIANILANPLIELASDIKNHLDLNGQVILSGFIEKDSHKLIDVYKNLGFKLEAKYLSNNWCSLVFFY